MKAKTVPAERKGKYGVGDVWTWVALDPETKLVPSWVHGGRGEAEAMALMTDLGQRLTKRTDHDGRPPALIDAIERVFGRDADYAMHGQGVRARRGRGAPV